MNESQKAIPEADYWDYYDDMQCAIELASRQIAITAYRKGQWRQLAYGIARLMADENMSYSHAYGLLAYETPKSDWLRNEALRLADCLRQEATDR